MAELLLTEVDDALVRELQKRAALHRRSPAEEAKSILSEVLSEQNHRSWTNADSIFNQFAASGRSFGDSADLLREDRDR